jgi:CheY-like chemotaxis protein
MPTMSGDKLAQMLRKNTKFSNLGIILVSGCEPEELSRIAGKVGATAVVHKSELHNQLLRAADQAAQLML